MINYYLTVEQDSEGVKLTEVEITEIDASKLVDMFNTNKPVNIDINAKSDTGIKYKVIK